MRQTLDDWIEGYRRAWEERDPKTAAELFSPEATYRSNIYEEPYKGRKGIESYWRTVTETQTDVLVRMGRPFVDGSRVTVEFWTTMRVNSGPVTLAGCLLLDFDDLGLCEALREYWHFQPGLEDPPADWGT